MHLLECIDFSDYDSFLAFSKVTGIETIHMFFPNTTGKPGNNTMNSPRKPIENEKNMKNVIGITFDFERKK